MGTRIVAGLLAVAGSCVWAAPEQKILFVGSTSNYVAKGLAALGIPHSVLTAREYTTTSPFDYDVILWGMDETRSALSADPAQVAAFVESGGVLLCFRLNTSAESWLPVRLKRDKAYAFGKILEPEHPVFNTPHKLTDVEMKNVHGGSIYDAFYDLGEGWIPLVSTGAEQNWDKREAASHGPHFGIIELPLGKGRLILSQMIPEYHWFHDSGGDAKVEGARLLENLVRYAMNSAGSRAATRPPREVPEGFRVAFNDIIDLPRRGDGIPLDAPEWRFTAEGPYSMKVDRRGIATFTHADAPSKAGSFAQLTRTVQVPREDGSVTLRWYESDTYCGGRERILGGADHGKTALQNYKKDMRYAQVLINDQVIWEQDVLGRNPQPARTRIRTADITDAVRAGNGNCELTLRVEDREDSGELPFAIDVFWATVDVITDMLRTPATRGFEAQGFTQSEDAQVLSAGQGILTREYDGPAGEFRIAVRLRDGVNGRSTVAVRVDDATVADWTLTADDHRLHWAVTGPVQLDRGSALRIVADCADDDEVEISEVAIVPERLASEPEPAPATAPDIAPGSARVEFQVSVPETAGVAREGEVAVQGVPFPQGCLKDPSKLRVIGVDGNPVPVGSRVIVRWPDGSVKVALLSFPVNVAAKGTATYTVQAGQGVEPLRTQPGVRVTDDGDLLTIRTGKLTATVSKTHGRIVEEVRRGEEIVKPVAEVWDIVLEDENGRVVRSGGETVTETTVVDAGPQRALILRKGSFADADGSMVDYRLQIEATAGSDALLVDSRIINREDTPEVYLKRWSMQLARAESGRGRAWLTDESSRAANPGAVLYQHRENVLTWTGEDGPQSRMEARSPGYVRLPGVAVGMRWFWERFPQAIRFGADELRLDFIPQAFDDEDLPTRWLERMREITDRYSVGGVGYPQSPGKMGLFRLTQGEALSAEVRLVFDGQDTSAPVRDALAPLSHRLRAVADPAYTASTGAFGVFQPTDLTRYARYETSVDGLYRSYLAKRERRREYGFENFGDDTFEWGYGPSYTYWSNSEYDHHHGFALQYLRSGGAQWWELAEQQARMYEDVVINHYAPEKLTQQGGPRHHNATSMWMPSHEDQCWIADHTCSGASAGHSWVQGMIDYWYLTGDPWAEEVTRALADWYCEIVEHNSYGAGGQERGPGWALIALSALNSAITDERLEQAGWTVANWIINYQDPIRGVVSVPISEQPSYEGGSTFMHGIVGRGLGRWYDFTGAPRVKDACIGIAEWITTEPMGPPGRFWYKQSPQNSRRFGPTSQCFNALTYAYVLTEDPWFAEVARALYDQTGAGIRGAAGVADGIRSQHRRDAAEGFRNRRCAGGSVNRGAGSPYGRGR